MPNIIEGIQNQTKQATRDLNRTINRTGGQISDAVSDAARDPNSLGFGQVNRTARDIRRGLDRAKNAPVNANFDINPFDDGKVGVEFSGGGLSVRARAGLGPTGNISGIGASAGASLEGVGGVDISVGVDPTKGKVNYIPGISVKNAQGRTVLTTDPIELANEVLKSIGERLEAETNAAEAKAAGEGIRSPSRRNPQQRQTQSQQRQTQSQQPSRPNKSPSLPNGTPQTIPTFPVQGSNEAIEAPMGEYTPPFQIPQNIPDTNTRLPSKPQLGGSTRQPMGNSSTKPKNIGQGGRIVRPEDMEDIRNNSPENKPKISQPPQPMTAFRLLTPREKQLFDCLQNGGGEACNKKYGKAQEAQYSSGDNNSGLSLSLGDPYIGLGNIN